MKKKNELYSNPHLLNQDLSFFENIVSPVQLASGEVIWSAFTPLSTVLAIGIMLLLDFVLYVPVNNFSVMSGRVF